MGQKDSNDPSALVLAMLCDFEGKDKQVVVNTILKRLRELNDDREYRNYLKMVNIYSTNRGLEKFNHSIDDMVKAFNIKKDELLEYIKRKEESSHK